MIDDDELQALEQRCKERGWDAGRLIQFANALHLMQVKYRIYKEGWRLPYVTCYKSKKAHSRQSKSFRNNF